MASFVEITNPIHGGAGWEFGSCLWSPVTNKGGQKSWELMAEPRPSNLVFHLLKEKQGAGYFLTGASRVSTVPQVIQTPPPEPDRWGDMAPYYRIPLEQFTRLSEPVSIDEILSTNRTTFEDELQRNSKGQFFERKASGRLQVSLKYIAKAELKVEEILLSYFQRSHSLPAQLEGETFLPTMTEPAYPDYTPPGSVETRVVRKIRDTALSRSIKAKCRYLCAICGYTIQLKVGGHYAEAHHMKPLGAGHNGPDTEDNLIVLCPTHHAEFDYGVLAINPANGKIEHSHMGPFQDRKPSYSLPHLSQEFLAYHYNNIFRKGSDR